MKQNVSYTGPGLATLLGAAFIVLRLCGVISWRWVWVLAPIWISLIIRLILLVAIYFSRD